MRGSALNTPATSVKISHTSAPSAAATATAVVSEPPRPSVVTSSDSWETPWKPATSTILPSSRPRRMRSALISMMRALVCPLSVTIPAWEPVSEIASCPRSLITIAASAQVTRSPVERSMSISRGSGRSETSYASDTSSSVCFPRAERTATTLVPASFAVTIRFAARLMRSASATEVPPNFITTVSVPRIGMAANDSRVPLGPVQTEPARRRLLIAVIAALALAAGVAGVVVGAGHDGDSGDAASTVPTPGRGKPQERVSFLARIVPPPAQRERSGAGAAVPRSVADLARRLPVERKVAQLFLFGFRGTDLTAEIFGRLRRLDLGGIVIAGPNYTDATQLGSLAGEAAVIASEERHVKPWVITSQEGGELNSFPDLPPAALPADLGSAAEAGAMAKDSASALHGLGVNGVLGPVVDVGGADTGSALGARVYSDQPEEVSAYAEESVGAYRAQHVFSAVKHFPGLGATDQSTEEGPATVGLSLDELRARDLIPFKAAIDAGVPGVVIGHALYPFNDFTLPASLSKQVVTGLLRGELHFRGVALTDDLADPAITAIHTVPDAAVQALAAGADMLYISGDAGDQEAAYVAVLRAVQRGRIPRRRLDQAVARILLAKRDYDVIRR